MTMLESEGKRSSVPVQALSEPDFSEPDFSAPDLETPQLPKVETASFLTTPESMPLHLIASGTFSPFSPSFSLLESSLPTLSSDTKPSLTPTTVSSSIVDSETCTGLRRGSGVAEKGA